VEAAPTKQELDLLSQLIEDGWPIVVIAPPRDDPEIARFQRTALSLLRRGLASIYGRPDDARDIPLAEAEAVIADPDVWGLWMISTTEAGNALLGAPNEW
jgi:hypothetical protein